MWIRIGAFDTERINARPEKGKSLLSSIGDYVALDVETTGTDPRWDEIIQIGAVRVRDGSITAQYETLVNPGFEIDDYISELTGITNEMLSTAPILNEVLPDVQNFIGKDIIIGHNVNFDINFLYDAFEEYEFPALSNDFIDTLRITKRLFPEWENHKLKTLVKNMNLPKDIFHNALADTMHAYHAYEYLRNYITQNGIDLTVTKKNGKYYPSHSLRAKDITATCTDYDPDNPYCGKTFVITGNLQRMDRKDAYQFIVDHGGICGDTVTKKTNYLVLGDYSQSRNVKDGKTGKLKKAEKLILKGQDLEIISEDVFFGMLEDYEALGKQSE